MTEAEQLIRLLRALYPIACSISVGLAVGGVAATALGFARLMGAI